MIQWTEAIWMMSWGECLFPTLWRKWIRECVCTAMASMLVNGSPTDEFSLHRGLRQCDPLSPFLFLLAVEGLNVLMEAMIAQNLFKGYNIGEQGSMTVSHLQFADDTLLLVVKSVANVRALRVVLVLFETMSGLKVNFNKNLLVGVNIPESWLGEAASVLCCKVGKISFLYLALQVGGFPRRLSFWELVLIRMKNRLSGWKSCFLSFGGRLVLLKSVLTSLPVYALSFFKALSGRRGSSWWNEIAHIRDGGSASGGSWFGEQVLKRVGDESDTFFWTDPWVDETPLCQRWEWRPDPATGYSVRGAYKLLTSHTSVTTDVADNLIWHSQVVLVRVDHFCSSFGSLAFGLYGRNETINCSQVQQYASYFVGQDQAFLF
ncbi:cysteine-rich receptor-like protein kinase [Trifolium pratense]|uniref:Cysteine-rich receptor-like protein kinase n=1 Tax=Trifolium pratense TaxID=57577 RepID=A0A2K3L8Y5_TRIPR|nr:cysteine-rich receptor-like protein kinase [Trifolium pratense]